MEIYGDLGIIINEMFDYNLFEIRTSVVLKFYTWKFVCKVIPG